MIILYTLIFISLILSAIFALLINRNLIFTGVLTATQILTAIWFIWLAGINPIFFWILVTMYAIEVLFLGGMTLMIGGDQTNNLNKTKTSLGANK